MAVTAAPYLALLDEEDPSLKFYALKSLDSVVNEFWPEISNSLVDIEELYDDESFEGRNLAALVASKVYYSLGDYESSVKFILASGNQFDVNEDSEFVETIVSKCIEKYVELRKNSFEKAETGSVENDSKLKNIFEKMLVKCVNDNNLNIAIGISLESCRLDVIDQLISQKITEKHEDVALLLISYALACLSTISYGAGFKIATLKKLVELIFKLSKPDYYLVDKLIVQLNDSLIAINLFKNLVGNDSPLIAYQSAFDLVQAANQELLNKTIAALKSIKSGNEKHNSAYSKIILILSGVPTSDFDATFLFNNNNTDLKILNQTKSALEAKVSIYHNAVSFLNAFLHAGTTDDSFLRNNLAWLGKSSNWSKFSATAALGVIHKGNLSQGKVVLEPYLPEKTGSSYSQGGSLYALGLIFAGHGNEVLDYLKGHIIEKSATTDENAGIILHGACLGIGVAAMGTGDDSIYEELKSILYSDSAVCGEAAAIAIGLVMLGSGNEEIVHDLMTYARETQHENIIRSLAMSISFIYFGKTEFAQNTIDELMGDEMANIRYGGCFTIALAYSGTGHKKAIKKLLHVAVSDSSDDVRRAAVISLGFVLISDYKTVPLIVELLSESYNPHVRYGTALALGISCSGKGNFQPALDLLEPLTKDTVDFVRQGALIATSMILIQQNEKSCSKLDDFKTKLSSTISAKGSDHLTKFGAAVAQGILDAGGRNVTINLENLHTGTLNTKGIIGLTLFVQSWYWFPLAHFLCLSFAPTTIIGVTEDLKIPDFNLKANCKKSVFAYPPKMEENKEKEEAKLETAILSTTIRAKQRKANKKGGDSEKMEIDEEGKSKEVNEKKCKKEDEEEADSYEFKNMSRVVPGQLKYVEFIENGRYKPVREFKNNGGVIILNDTKPEEKASFIKTVKQMNIKDAPLPEPFSLDEEIDVEVFASD